MECLDVQQLLAFTKSKSAELDAPEQAAIQEHLEQCPDCSAIAQAEQRLDEVIGPVLRDVPVPAGLKERLTSRLSAERGAARWRTAKRVGALAAVVLLCLIVAGTTWSFWPLPDVAMGDIDEFAQVEFGERGGWTDEQVKEFFLSKGLRIDVPGEFSFEHLRRIEIVEFKGRRVAKLSFVRILDNGQTATADLVILPHKQFRVDKKKVEAQDLHNVTSIRIVHKDGYTYLIFYRNSIDVFLRVLN